MTSAPVSYPFSAFCLRIRKREMHSLWPVLLRSILFLAIDLLMTLPLYLRQYLQVNGQLIFKSFQVWSLGASTAQ